MTDEATTATADAGTSAQNLTEGTDSAQSKTTPNDATDNQGSEKTFTQADINRIVAKAEKSAVAAALKVEAEKKADAELSEAQKEKKRADEAEQAKSQAEVRMAQMVVRNAVTIAVADPKLNARDPKALAMLVNVDALEVEADEVKGIDAELKRLKAAHPALFFGTTADGAAQGSSSGVFDFNNEIRRKAGRG